VSGKNQAANEKLETSESGLGLSKKQQKSIGRSEKKLPFNSFPHRSNSSKLLINFSKRVCERANERKKRSKKNSQFIFKVDSKSFLIHTLLSRTSPEESFHIQLG
jgi:hypothetical protein